MPYYENQRPSFWQSIPVVTRNILLINVVVFIATEIDLRLLHDSFLLDAFALYYPTFEEFRFWQFLTCMFTHADFGHLFFNMFSLLMFGPVIERTLGTRRYLIFYLLCGLGGSALFLGVQALQVMHAVATGTVAALAPVIGASGAIYGILIAFGLLNPNATIVLLIPPIPMKAKWWVLIFVGIELITGITGTNDGVAHFGHLGGMLVGAILILYWRKTGKLYQW